ncbi:MAG: glycosyltransferase [candidate division Zixibacteria bacterium]|nr:glycosyltransferase [candidate division Zixibacteria bacterium]
MRLLVITNMYPREEDPSFGSFVYEQHESLKAAGIDADLYFIEGYRGRLAYLRAVRALRARRHDYDLFHAHHAYSAAAALVAGARPLVATFHDNPVVTSPLYRRFARAVARRADRFIAVTPAAARALAPVRCVHIPMGTDLELFRPRDKFACRHELGLAADKKYVLFPADPTRRSKRFDLAAEGVELGRRLEPSLELLTFHPAPRLRVPVYFGAADVVLVSSDVELGPLTVKEAIASARPVVSRRVGDVEFLDACDACIPVGDAARDIAEGIIAALSLPPVDAKMVEPYGMRAVAGRLISLYNEVVYGASAAADVEKGSRGKGRNTC